MTRYTRVHLLPRGPFHFGGRGVGMERSDVGLSADGLFSALCVVIAQHHGENAVLELLARFCNASTPAQVPFRLTSLMPFAAAVRFLPYPTLGPPPVPHAHDLQRRKEFKRIEWVSEAVFRHLARAETPIGAIDGDDCPLTIHGGKVWLAQAEANALAAFQAIDPVTQATQSPVLWRSDVRPRVAVDRRSQASAVYATGSTHFNRMKEPEDSQHPEKGRQESGDKQAANERLRSAGLYTVIEWLDAETSLQALITQAFERLGDAGIGGERSYGHGHFKPVFDEMPVWNLGAEHGAYFTTLAPYHPRPEEQDVLGAGARYEITLRRGWLSLPGYQNLRRASVRMLADGSVLRWPRNGEPLGNLADVTPKRLRDETGLTVYRYGLAFPVRVADAAMSLKEAAYGSS